MTEYEIIADPKEYGIEKLVDGLNGSPIEFPPEERAQWAQEVGAFATRLNELSDKATSLQTWLAGDAAIKSTPASLKTLKYSSSRSTTPSTRPSTWSINSSATSCRASPRRTSTRPGKVFLVLSNQHIRPGACSPGLLYPQTTDYARSRYPELTVGPTTALR